MIITGIPYGNPKGWFYFQFTEGAGRKQALHISVRFDPYFVVIRNSMSENSMFVIIEALFYKRYIRQQFVFSVLVKRKNMVDSHLQ